jgi:hypothetical protein
MTLFQGFLFAHVLGAIIAFGPSFSFPIIGRLGAGERQHANFATRVSAMLSRVQVVPFAILQGITGVGLIIAGNIDVMARGWLLIAIVLYLTAIGYALFVQTPTVKKVIEMTSGGPPAGAPGGPSAGASAGGPPAGGPPAGGPPAGGPPAGGQPPGGPAPGGPPAGPPGGPPPELMRLIRRVQLGGMFLMALIVSIVFLMVVKPGG